MESLFDNAAHDDDDLPIRERPFNARRMGLTPHACGYWLHTSASCHGIIRKVVWYPHVSCNPFHSIFGCCLCQINEFLRFLCIVIIIAITIITISHRFPFCDRLQSYKGVISLYLTRIHQALKFIDNHYSSSYDHGPRRVVVDGDL